MSGINFMAEIARRSLLEPLSATPSLRWSRQHNIYEIYRGKRPVNTYWTDWGGWYDNEETTKIEVYLVGFLYPAANESDLLNTSRSIWADGDYVYINVPKHPWLYDTMEAAMSVLDGYLSAPKNAARPSDLRIDGRLFAVRLDVPSVSVKLSDPISGLTKYSAFSLSLLSCSLRIGLGA